MGGVRDTEPCFGGGGVVLGSCQHPPNLGLLLLRMGAIFFTEVNLPRNHICKV